jgi:pSer/pThr/pTyr-binding forkhead associated (FHA) protein
MSMLELGGKRFTIPLGEVALGSDPSCAIALTGPGLLAKHAVLQGQPDGQVVIRKAVPEADVMINGVRLGAEPTPLLHGDKLQVAGHELTFVDERRSGSTQFVPAMMVPSDAAPRPGGAARSVGTTGGRLVSLTDGREYVIMAASLVLGREAGCDVVVPGKDVSRRHAEIVPSPKGYVLVDSSTNGVWVNEERVEGQRLLARADVIRIGEESFRFYSDAVPAPGPAAVPAASPPAPGAGARLQNTSFGMPATPRPTSPTPSPAGAAASSGPLANFLVRSGGLKGTRLIVKTPVANIGRADYNDLVLPDESVSTSHAKLQRREGVWVLMDLASTNGTYVDGERIGADTPIAPGTLVRFGDVQLVFEPTDDALGVAKGGGTKVIESFKPPAAAPAPPAPPPPPPAPRVPAPAPAAAAPAVAAAAPVAAAAAAATPPKAAAQPAKPGPSAAPAKTPPKPSGPPRRPAAQAPQKKGKGCGSSAAVIVLAASALIYWILV